MEETSTQAEIQDDLPTWHSELNESWEKRIKPFVDLGSFLRQRRKILQHPELTYNDEAHEKEWKKPFEFALSATILTFTFIG